MNLTFYCAANGMPQPRVSGELFEAGFYSLDNLPGHVDPDQLVVVQRALRIREMPELAWGIPTDVVSGKR